jgi:hypothetical protein
LLLIVALVLAAPAPVLARAQAPQQVLFEGDPAKRWIENDDLGFYYQVPTGRRLRAEVDGPGTLILFLVNHRMEGARAQSTLLVTRNNAPWKRLKLGCARTKLRFTAGKSLPCARLTRDLKIPEGKQELGFELSKTRWGASVRLLFIAQAVLDAEPELVASMAGRTEEEGEAAEWQPAVDVDLAAIPTESSPPSSAATAPGRDGSGAAEAGSSFSSTSLALVLAGVAAAAGGAGTYFGLRSRSKFSDAGDTYVQVERDELNGSGKTSALIANILFGVAALGVGSAVFVFVAEPLGAAPGGEGGSAVGLRLGLEL